MFWYQYQVLSKKLSVSSYQNLMILCKPGSQHLEMLSLWEELRHLKVHITVQSENMKTVIELNDARFNKNF